MSKCGELVRLCAACTVFVFALTSSLAAQGLYPEIPLIRFHGKVVPGISGNDYVLSYQSSFEDDDSPQLFDESEELRIPLASHDELNGMTEEEISAYVDANVVTSEPSIDYDPATFLLDAGENVIDFEIPDSELG